uniref:Uncharacterized protein n=1 Tax=Ditylenchus dipsaci TaxID=166011 RepID=A0A915ERE3_9BILA
MLSMKKWLNFWAIFIIQEFQNLDEHPVQDSLEVLAQLIEKQSSVSKRMIKSDLHDTPIFVTLSLPTANLRF